MTLTEGPYIAIIEFDDGDESMHGRILNMRAVITFEGRTLDELRAELRTSVAVYEAGCARDGVEPQRPYSGRFVTRIDPALHAQVASAAALSGTSLNAWVAEQLERGVETA